MTKPATKSEPNTIDLRCGIDANYPRVVEVVHTGSDTITATEDYLPGAFSGAAFGYGRARHLADKKMTVPFIRSRSLPLRDDKKLAVRFSVAPGESRAGITDSERHS